MNIRQAQAKIEDLNIRIRRAMARRVMREMLRSYVMGADAAVQVMVVASGVYSEEDGTYSFVVDDVMDEDFNTLPLIGGGEWEDNDEVREALGDVFDLLPEIDKGEEITIFLNVPDPTIDILIT